MQAVLKQHTVATRTGAMTDHSRKCHPDYRLLRNNLHKYPNSEIKDFECNPGAGYGICQSMVMMLQVIAVILRHGLKSVVRNTLA